MNKAHAIDIDVEVAKFFDDSSLSHDGTPNLIVVTGGNAAGKTTLIHDKYKQGYVIINAEDIYRNIKIFDDFGEVSRKLVNEVGEAIAKKAIIDHRNIVLEMIGATEASITPIIDALLEVGYKVDIQLVTADITESYERHLKAVAEDNAYLPTTLTEDYHRAWILKALSGLAKN